MYTPKFEGNLEKFVTTNAAYKASLASVPPPVTLMAGTATAGPLKGEGEIKKYYTFDQSGSILISSTVGEEEKMEPEVRKVFQKVIVFFGALTAAITKAGKDMYDYDALEAVIGKSGLFISIHQEDRTFMSGATSLTLDTAIIETVLGIAIAPESGALAIAKQVISGMGKQIQLSVSGKVARDKVAHLLFICENLMGMPIVSISLFYIDMKQAEVVTKSNCHQSITETLTFKYHQHSYLFVDPDYINKFSEDFKDNPEYQELINKLAGYIPKDKKK